MIELLSAERRTEQVQMLSSRDGLQRPEVPEDDVISLSSFWPNSERCLLAEPKPSSGLVFKGDYFVWSNKHEN